MADQALLTKADLPEIIQRYLAGASIQDIAQDARVARRTIYKWIHRIGDKDYYDVVTDAMVTRLADADHELSIAREQGHIARAREEAKFTRWDLERRRPTLFGPKQEIKQDTSITIIIQAAAPVVQNAPVILQAEAQAVTCLPDSQAVQPTSTPKNNDLA